MIERPKSVLDVWASIKRKFDHVATLKLKDGLLSWECNEQAGSEPSVYVWTLRPGIEDESESVIYVGMAGRGWCARSKQHNAGLRRVHIGKETGEAWRHQYDQRAAWLRAGRQIDVFERRSDVVVAFGHAVAIQHAEERALIHLLDPLFNRG